MSGIIPFESAKLPAYLSKFDIGDLNSDLTAHASQGFPVLSIKGKSWAVVRDGERNLLTREIDGEKVAAPHVDVVLVKASKHKSKVFYLKNFKEGDEPTKPDCYSTNGDKPEADSPHPQAKVCATCPKNQWGSKVSDNGSKGKACSDTVRMAVAPAGQTNDPMLLRVPPASIKPLGEYGKMLAKRGVAYNMVVTRLSFDSDAATPKLVFTPKGFLPEEAFREVQEVAQGDVVEAILGAAVTELPAETPEAPAPASAPVVASKSKTVSVEEIDAAVGTVTAKSKPAVKDPEVSMPGLNLDDLNFDD